MVLRPESGLGFKSFVPFGGTNAVSLLATQDSQIFRTGTVNLYLSASFRSSPQFEWHFVDDPAIDHSVADIE
jgi:hypothetical protein